MKKLFIFILFILVISAAALFVFVVTFDANKYKGMLAEKIESAIDRDVKIGNISLNLLPGLAFRIEGLAIKDRDKPWDSAILKAGSIDASIKPLPLIKKDVEIENLKLRGLEIEIDRDSLITAPWAGMPNGIQGNTGVAAAGALKFLAESISITDSSVRYVDKNPSQPMDIRIDVIDAVIRNVSLYGPANIRARLSVFGRGAENLNLKATLYPEVNTGKPYVKNLELTVDLSKLDMIDALAAFGKSDIASQYIGEEMSGRIVVSAPRLNLDPKDIYNSSISLALSEGALTVMPIKETVKSIGLKAELKAGDITIRRLDGFIADGSFSAKGIIKDMLSDQESDIDITLEDINLAKLLPDPAPGRPGFEGAFGVTMHSQSSGLTEQKILDTLTASGSINLDRAVMTNMNVLSAALDKLDTLLPGLVAELKAKLPDRYKELLKQKDTVFKPINLDFKMQNGKIVFQKAIVESDAFYLSGSGYLGLNRDMSVNSDIFIPKDFSEAFIAVVRQLSYLQNSQGLITMPVTISGRIPDVSVKPDMDYVMKRLTVAAGEELFRNIFRKEEPQGVNGEPGAGTGSEGGVQTQEKKKPKPEEELIRTIFDIISGPKEE